MTTTATPSKLREVRGARFHQKVSPDVFEDNISELPEEQRDVLSFWFYFATERGLSQKELARRTGVSDSALSLAFRNKYPADLSTLCKTLEAARDNLTSAIANPHFIMTALAKQLWEVFDDTRAMQSVTIAWGAMGIGKTEVAKEYKRRHNHGRTFYHRCSPAMTFGQFVTSLAQSMGIPSKRHSHLRLREKIIGMLAAGQRLLIIDELHELFLQKERSRGIAAVLICEFLREVYDKADCGLVLIGTRAMVTHLKEGDHSAALEQLIDRGEDPVELPGKPTEEDAHAFIRHYGLDPTELLTTEQEAAVIVRDIFAASGLRKLTRHLRAGAAAAAKKGEQYQWHHFVAAHKRHASILKKPAKP